MILSSRIWPAALHLARGVASLACDLGRSAIELVFERGHFLAELGASIGHLLRALLPLASGRREAARFVGDLAVLLLNFLGLALGVFDVALGALALRACSSRCTWRRRPPLPRQPAALRVAVGCRPAHRVGCLLHLSRRVLQVRAVLLARQALELTGRFLGLLRELALQVAPAHRPSAPAAPLAAVGAAAPAPAGAPAP